MKYFWYFSSKLLILKNIQARWKLMRNTFFEENLMRCLQEPGHADS